MDVSYAVDQDVYQILNLNETARSFSYNSGEYTVHKVIGTNLYLVYVDDWSLTNIYPSDCPDDDACLSVRSPGCITDDDGECVSIVTDVCNNPDTPTLSSVTCSSMYLDDNTMCILENGVSSDFCATNFAYDCEDLVNAGMAVGTVRDLSIGIVSVFLLLLL